MGTAVQATQPIVKHPSDSQQYAANFTSPLYGRTVASATGTADNGITVSGVSRNSSSYTDDSTGATVDQYKAVLFTLAGGTAGRDYEVTLTATLSDGSTLTGVVAVEVRDH